MRTRAAMDAAAGEASISIVVPHQVDKWETLAVPENQKRREEVKAKLLF
jgi:hypothetical protein